MENVEENGWKNQSGVIPKSAMHKLCKFLPRAAKDKSDLIIWQK